MAKRGYEQDKSALKDHARQKYFHLKKFKSIEHANFRASMKVKKSEDNNELQKAYKALGIEDLIKGGEGSKGGKVIGHTKSGKPIYAKMNDTKHFTHKDHVDAYNKLNEHYKNDESKEANHDLAHHFNEGKKKQESEGITKDKKEQYASYTDEQLNEEHKQYLAGNEYGDEKMNKQEHRDFKTLSRARKIEYLVEPTKFFPTEAELQKMK